MMTNNEKLRAWLFKMLAKVEEYEVAEASLTSFEKFGENFELKIRFGDERFATEPETREPNEV